MPALQTCSSSATLVERRATAARERQQVAAVVHDGDGHVPLVLQRLGAGCGLDLLAILNGENRFGLHRFSR
jgi:hypothetical protein